MMPAGRIGNRNKTKAIARNYAKVCDSEEKQPEEDEQ